MKREDRKKQAKHTSVTSVEKMLDQMMSRNM